MINQKAFIAALKAASTAMGKHNVRYHLNGVAIQSNGPDSLTIVGTDGHRMVVVQMRCTHGMENGSEFILSGACVKLMLKAFKTRLVSDYLLIRNSDTPNPTFYSDVREQEVITETIDGKFVDWRRVSKNHTYEDSNTVHYLNATYLSDMAKAMSGLSGNYDGVKMEVGTTGERLIFTVREQDINVEFRDYFTRVEGVIMPMRL